METTSPTRRSVHQRGTSGWGGGEADQVGYFGFRCDASGDETIDVCPEPRWRLPGAWAGALRVIATWAAIVAALLVLWMLAAMAWTAGEMFAGSVIYHVGDKLGLW